MTPNDSAPLPDFEQLGAFYLGRAYDLASGETEDELLLYDSKDLTTHAVCVGMTGSGKTGLCISLLEEAAIDGIPALIVDPKGDMGNLCLNFTGLTPEEFEPWVDAGEAARKKRTPREHAEATAKLWRDGLASWGQGPERLARLRDAAEVRIYTPGSAAGTPLTVLRSFEAPPAAVLEDPELLGDRVEASVGGLLALVGIEADPVGGRESILLANLLQHAWTRGESLTLADLVRLVQAPPFDKLGVLDLESFFPAKDRMKLAMTLNGVLASPTFAPWLEGEPLDVPRLLYTPEGKPRLAVLSIAHLSEAERMFFVTILLGEVLAWIRTQPGTSSLRALLYMDEIFGFFPPSKEPPAKRPMLTLLKQARAYGLGVVLATQNPVDLDYKGLSNTGTWFIGRLQTERDKLRVLDGLEGALSGAGGFDRAELDRTLSGLDKRVFLMHDVHEERPVVFHTRWAMSYLRGPLTRAQIKTLCARDEARRPAASAVPAPTSTPVRERGSVAAAAQPAVPREVPQTFEVPAGSNEDLVYAPTLRARVRLHYANARAQVDAWRELVVVAPLAAGDTAGEAGVDWDASEVLEAPGADLADEPAPGAAFEELPAAAQRAKSYATWSRQLAAHLYREAPLRLLKCAEHRLTSRPDEGEGEFRARVALAAKEERDAALDKLKARYKPKLERVQERIRKAEERVDREEEQLSAQRKSSWVSVGTTLLGSLLGRKVASATNVRRAGTSLRSMGRTSKEKADVERARREVEAKVRELEELEQEFRTALEDVKDACRPEDLEFEELLVPPRKTDTEVALELCWTLA